MAINFPSSPSNGTEVNPGNNITYRYVVVGGVGYWIQVIRDIP